jgi:hypothetical protein
MIIAYGNSIFKYPESFGRLQCQIPEKARSLQWFLSLPEDARVEIARTIAEKGFINAVKMIQLYCKFLGNPNAIEIDNEKPTTKPRKGIELSDSPVSYLLLHDRYVLIVDRTRIKTDETFKLCFRHVAIAQKHGETIIKFGKNLNSLRSKVGREVARSQGLLKASDFTIHDLKPAAMGV